MKDCRVVVDIAKCWGYAVDLRKKGGSVIKSAE